MEAHPRSPRALFEGKEHYEIPAFQRPYVWNEEDQWAPLWDDVVRVAESYVVAREQDTKAEPKLSHHFLGAVVYESKPPIAGDVARHDVIDGQQRMATLQILIDATRQVLAERGHEDMAEALEELTRNGQTAFKGKRERFKLWPSQADRTAYVAVMDPRCKDQVDHKIADAHAFFLGEANRWVSGEPDEDAVVPPGAEELRVEALASTIQDRLLVVAIDLTGHDDAQLIFETLNDRGTPLLKADLIKNWVFRRAEQLGADTESWAEAYWSDFDTPWWREEITQGRLSRSRVDIFLQYWLTMRRTDEVKAEHVFRVFVDYAAPLMSDPAASETLLAAMRRDADTYKSFAQLDVTTPAGHFHRLVVETMEMAATTPVFLWLLSENHGVPGNQLKIGLAAIESWVIRRSVLRLTTKDINKFMVALLKVLHDGDPKTAGVRLLEFLSRQTADTRYWPSDQELRDRLPEVRMYGNIRQGRIRAILSEVERHLRAQNTFYEAVALPSGLEIEHIMPQGWRTHWDPEPPLGPEDASQRDRLINTIGNLTLTTKSLNASLSNRPWTDAAAQGLKDGGSIGQGKHTLLNQFSLLVINKQILLHEESWTEQDIRHRSNQIVNALCEVWPGPDMAIQEAVLEATRTAKVESPDQPPAELANTPWTQEDMNRLANETSPVLTALLDTLALHPGQLWNHRRFVDAGVTNNPGGALGALTNKARGPFRRAEGPVHYEKIDGVWHWSLPDDLAALWRTARNLSLPPEQGENDHTVQ